MDIGEPNPGEVIIVYSHNGEMHFYRGLMAELNIAHKTHNYDVLQLQMMITHKAVKESGQADTPAIARVLRTIDREPLDNG